MMKPIGAALVGLPPSGGAPAASLNLRTGQAVQGPMGRSSLPGLRVRDPVRRGSKLAGTCEGAFWRRTDRAEVRRVLLAAKRYELAGRQPGHRRGPLGHVALEALELLSNLVSYRSGRLEPSLRYLMQRLRRSKDAVVRALAALREHGFLDWLRRHERVELVEGPGPRVRQVSNAYRMLLPARAARLLGHMLGEALVEGSSGIPARGGAGGPGIGGVPLPDDVLQEREERAAWLREHKAGLPLSELPLLDVQDDRLARVLGELGRAVEERAQERARTSGLAGQGGRTGQERGREAGD